jgi:hypothetical protein
VSVHGISSQTFTCKKFKTQVLAGKLMATIFWDVDGVIHMDFLEPGTTTNPDRYIATLKTLKQRLTLSGQVLIYNRHNDSFP